MFAAAFALAVAWSGEPAAEPIGPALPPAVPQVRAPPPPRAEASESSGGDLGPQFGAPPPPRGHGLTAGSTTLAASSALWSVTFLAARNDPDYEVPGSLTQIRRDEQRRLRQDVALGINLGLFGAATVGSVVGALRIRRFDRWRQANAIAPVHDGTVLTGAGIGLLTSGVTFGASTAPALFYRSIPASIGTWAGVTAAYLIGGSVATVLGVRKQRRSRAVITGRYGVRVASAGAPGYFAFGLAARGR